MTIRNAARTALAAILMLGFAFAQGNGSPASQAVIAFMNILDHNAVLAAEASVGTDPGPLALALLDHLDEQAILAPDVSAPMRTSVLQDDLDRGVFVLYLTDLLNGFDPLQTRVPEEAERILNDEYCGLVVPEGTVPEGMVDPVLDNMDVGNVVQQFIDGFQCILPNLRDTYGDPVE